MRETEMEDPEQTIFDLKLSISELQQQLSLHRNGTTTADLMSMLEEKDVEIGKLKDNLSVKDALISELGKKSKKVLTDYEVSEKKRKALEAQVSKSFESGKQEVMKHLLLAKKEISTLRTENESLTNCIDLLIPETEQFRDHIDELETDAIHASTDIEKLQDRCVNVVKENKQKKKELIERVNRAEEEVKKAHIKIDKYHQEVIKAQKFNESLKERITKEKQSSEAYKERICFLEMQLKVERPLEKEQTKTISERIASRKLVPFGKDDNSSGPVLSAFAVGESM